MQSSQRTNTNNTNPQSKLLGRQDGQVAGAPRPAVAANMGPGSTKFERQTQANHNKLASSSGAAVGPAAAKIDPDLLNVANENRVILNVGGIRHETYKVSMNFYSYS